MGLSTSGAPDSTPMQLVALEERVLYSAGPIPGEVVDVDLLSQGDFQGIDASDLGIDSIELAATDTLEFLQQQIDDANTLDSIEAIEPLELVPSDLGDGDLLSAEVPDILAGQFANEATQLDDAAVSSDLQAAERVTAAVSAGFESGVDISGRVLHDVDGDGDVDEQLGLGGVEVRLYTDLRNELLGDRDLDNFVYTTTTNEFGEYEFTDLQEGQTYFVVVNGSTLGNQLDYNFNIDAGQFFSNNDVFGEQTYASEGALFDRGDGQEFTTTDGALFSGRTSDGSDAAQVLGDTGGFEHVIRSLNTVENQTDVDFGFSFNVVTNTRGGDLSDDDPNSARTIQGSLRQFIANANAIVGDNVMRFVPVVDPGSTSASGDFYEIEVINQLNTIRDEGTVINGSVYSTDGSPVTQADGDIVNANALPTGSSVDGVDDSLLGPNFRPSLTLSGDNVGAGLIIQASRTEVSNLAVVNFFDGIIVQNADLADVTIHDNFIGAHADGSQASRFQNIGVNVSDVDFVSIQNNIIFDSRVSGINIRGLEGDPAEGTVIANNVIVNQRDASDDFGQTFGESSDGISLTGVVAGTIVSNNLITDSVEFGIDLLNSSGGVTIKQNTILDAGFLRNDDVLVGGAIGLSNQGNEVLDNEIVGNFATGILVRGTEVTNFSQFAASGNLVSSNYFEANAGLDIDITRPDLFSGQVNVGAGDGMDALDGFNDDAASDGIAGNRGIDHPVLNRVELAGDVLTIEGSYFDGINAPQIELYLLGDNDSRLYLDTINVTEQASFDPSTGEFSVELEAPVDLPVGSQVAAIVIDGSTSDTSEFSLSATVAQGLTAFENANVPFGVVDKGDVVGAFPQFTIVGGADSDLFDVRVDTGELRFLTVPDFENPHDSDQDGVYSVVIHIEDELGNETDREVNVTVLDVLEVAVFDRTDFNQNENQSDEFQLSATPNNDATFKYTFEPGGDLALFDLDRDDNGEFTGEFSFLDDPDFEIPLDEDENNIYSFTVTATSTDGHTVTDTISVTVIDDPNDNPPTVNESVAYDQFENEIVTHQLAQVADDGRAFTRFSFEGDSLDLFKFNSGLGTFFLKDAPDFELPADGSGDNVYSFTVTSFVRSEAVVTNDIDLTVNDVLEFNRTMFEQEENRTDLLLLSVNPGFGDFTFQLNDGGDSDAITLNSDGTFELRTAPDFETDADADLNGEYLFSVTATSTTDSTINVTAPITVTVTDVNEAADFDLPDASFSIVENTTFVTDFDSTNPEGGRVIYSISGADADLFSISQNHGVLEFLTAPDFETDPVTYSLVVRVEDPDGLGTNRDVTVTVTDVDEAADFDSLGVDFSIAENSSFVTNFDSTDPEQRGINYSLSGGDVDLFTISQDSGELEFKETPNFENLPTSNIQGSDPGTYSVVVRVEDPEGNGTDRDVTVTVTDVVETVLAIDDSAVVDEGGIVLIDAVANDEIDSLDRLTQLEVVSVSNGTASINGLGQIEFTHDDSETTSAQVTYRIVNEEGDDSLATVDIVVNPVDDLADTANDDFKFELDGLQDSSISVAQLISNDFDGDSDLGDFRLEIVGQPSQGTVTVDGDTGNVVFTPNEGFDGSDVVFEYQLVDPTNNRSRSDVARVSIEFSAPPVVPTPTSVTPPPPATVGTPSIDAESQTDPAEEVSSDVTTNPTAPPQTVESDIRSRQDELPPPQPVIVEPVETLQSYVAPTDLSSDDDQDDLSLEFQGNVYTYVGRTQFLELANLELSGFQLRDSVLGESDQGDQMLLSQLIVGVSNMNTSDSDNNPVLSVGFILDKAPWITGAIVLASVVGFGGLTFTGSQMYQNLDVASLLNDDESIEDIISS